MIALSLWIWLYLRHSHPALNLKNNSLANLPSRLMECETLPYRQGSLNLCIFHATWCSIGRKYDHKARHVDLGTSQDILDSQRFLWHQHQPFTLIDWKQLKQYRSAIFILLPIFYYLCPFKWLWKSWLWYKTQSNFMNLRLAMDRVWQHHRHCQQ